MSEENPKVPRTWLGRAYLRQLEPRLYGLFRDILIETDVPGQREKSGSVGPIRLLRPCRPGEPPFLKTVDPVTGEEFGLTEEDVQQDQGPAKGNMLITP